MYTNIKYNFPELFLGQKKCINVVSRKQSIISFRYLLLREYHHELNITKNAIQLGCANYWVFARFAVGPLYDLVSIIVSCMIPSMGVLREDSAGQLLSHRFLILFAQTSNVTTMIALTNIF